MESFEQRFDEVEHKLESIEGNVEKLLFLLTGNSINKNDPGMVGEFAQLKSRVAKLERWKDRVVYFLIGASFFAGWTIPDILMKFFKH
jgi:hypothetical protein